MGDFLNVAADWLERGRPGEQSALAEAAAYGALLWSADGVRAYERQGEDAYRLTLVGAGSAMTYEIVGVEGGWLR
ncbi:hypothetical protein FNH09_23470 [Streptomyces adustus]|uniref:Uncharacterized protein n=1 Tax=Streptomyces adustus TaxID=1609272 RepID=A0A5N8VJ17_9ACTN|nr:hypothetical protein [Streptomyces adustus]MPY34098.1 hypothetical protein [Streptomyces adustus]